MNEQVNAQHQPENLSINEAPDLISTNAGSPNSNKVDATDVEVVVNKVQFNWDG